MDALSGVRREAGAQAPAAQDARSAVGDDPERWGEGRGGGLGKEGASGQLRLLWKHSRNHNTVQCKSISI